MRLRLLIAALVGITAGVLFYRIGPKPLPELTRAELLVEVRTGHVHSISIDDDHIIIGTSTTRGRFRVMHPSNEPELLAELRARGVEVVHEGWQPSLI